MKIKRLNWNILISILITAGFVCCSAFLFQDSFIRLWDNLKNLGYSCVFVFNRNLDWNINDTSGLILPYAADFEGVKVAVIKFFNLFVQSSVFVSYVLKIFKGFVRSLYFLIFIPPVLLLFIRFSKRYFKPAKKEQSSTPYKFWMRVSSLYNLVKIKLLNYISWVIGNRIYLIWLLIWLLNFNIITIVVGFLAYYIYFVFSFDFTGITSQLFKLFYDLYIFTKIPWYVWAAVAFIYINKKLKDKAYDRLQHMELRNRGFINERPIVTMICGSMGKGKNLMEADMALSLNSMFRDEAFKRLYGCDLKFPNFPWINLEREIKRGMDKGFIYNLSTCKKYINHIKGCFEAGLINSSIYNSCKRHLKKKYYYNYDNLFFGYDFERYDCIYNDRLNLVHIWEVIRTYARLYFIYIIESSLIISNYSVREDDILIDKGHFPMWDNDFFKRDSRILGLYSKFAHILDFDSLRLGKKVLDDNPMTDAYEFGVVLISEIGKERGNKNELEGVKKKEECANQKNDLFNTWLKMIRHSATIDNYPFCKVLTDDQRPSSWGADARDLADIVNIVDRSAAQLAIGYHNFIDWIGEKISNKLKNIYYRYRHVRSDDTLFIYFIKAIAEKIYKYRQRLYNQFGFSVLSLEVERGTLDEKSNREKKAYYLSHKKIFSERYATDCFADYFTQKSLRSKIGLENWKTYAGVRASMSELDFQNSYFIDDLDEVLKVKEDVK